VKPELISFVLCPFVQRSVITLRHKKIDYDITFIDLENTPEWFKSLSPMGKVPVLKTGPDSILFESAVINEYLDETTPGSLLPTDPLQKANNRSWIAFGEQCLGDQYQWATNSDADLKTDKATNARSHLQRLEEQMGDGPYFNGAEFSLVDCAYAPLFMRYRMLEEGERILDQQFPKLGRWADTLLAMDEVSGSVVQDFETQYLGWLKKHGSLLL